MHEPSDGPKRGIGRFLIEKLLAPARSSGSLCSKANSIQMQPSQLETLASESSFWSLYYGLTMDVTDAISSLLTSNSNGTLTLTVSIPCPGGAVETSFNAEYWSIELTLITDTGSQRYEMGWWDDARQHPNALRWEELRMLQQYWTRLRGGLESSVWFLLLAPFVGTGENERNALDERRQTVAAQLRERNILPNAADDLAKAAIHKPPERDYDWQLDSELGWVFSGEYPCYSIRNRAHADGACGRFPFREWQEVISRVETLNKRT